MAELSDCAPSRGGERTPPAFADEHALVGRLRARDEEAFRALLDGRHAALVRLAGAYVADRDVAEDVAQETWIAVLQGIDRFEGRSSLTTWIFGILINQARRRGRREGRSIPFSALAAAELDDGEPLLPAARFLPAGHRWAGHWASPPRSWDDAPEERLLGREAESQIAAAIDALPPAQRLVIAMRDVHGCSAGEVCGALGLTDANQRVLLHRARTKVRRALARYLTDEEA
ncbi:MAG TPA: sigma-70 family RNA polymerase sigma factor [Thermomicrobiales bacterium]|nr:sigma-70 family RNA polymerase sigma factor [Thermomicrobiales bacterium]